MEREVPVFALVYLDRLFQVSKLTVTTRNWKKLVLVALLLASKVWDDESVDSFQLAQAYTAFPLKAITAAERLFVTLIDCNMNVKQAEYAATYFKLRTYATMKDRAYQLRPLDLHTVLKFQNGESLPAPPLQRRPSL